MRAKGLSTAAKLLHKRLSPAGKSVHEPVAVPRFLGFSAELERVAILLAGRVLFFQRKILLNVRVCEHQLPRKVLPENRPSLDIHRFVLYGK